MGFFPFFLSVTLLYGIVVGVVEHADIPLSGLRGVVVSVCEWGAVMAGTGVMLGFIMVWRRVFAVAFPLLMLITGVALYFKMAMGITVTPLGVELAAINGAATAFTMITWQLVVSALGGLLIGCALAWWRWRRVSAPRSPWVWFILFGVATGMLEFAPQSLKRNMRVRVPWSVIYSVNEYATNIRSSVAQERKGFDNVSATCGTDSLTVVVILGESLRSDHMQINGYHRPTTPGIAAEEHLVSIPRMRSNYYYTHLSVPHIVTRADSATEERAQVEPSFVPLFRNAGFRTAWVSNQDYAEAYGSFMHSADTCLQYATTKTLYFYNKWLDTDLLPGIDSVLSEGAARQLLVLHTIGSHWWYPAHYTEADAKFRPEVNSKILSELSVEQIINSYDNTILASDRFWMEVIDRLRRRRAVVIYISDHGESLGENGRLLHSPDGEEMSRVGAFVWMSDSYVASFPDKAAALRRRAKGSCSTDVVFHTVLSGADISTPVLNPQLSLFND